MNALAADYLFLDALLQARLRQRLDEAFEPGAVPVEGVEQLSQAVDAQDMRARVVYVMWGGDRFPDNVALGTAIRQRWLVLLRVRHGAAGALQRNARNRNAGELLSLLHLAVAGWAPDGANSRSFSRAQGPAPSYSTASALYPLAFDISLHL